MPPTTILQQHEAKTVSTTAGSTFADSVCDMLMQEDSRHRWDLAGKMHRFCSTSVLERFKADSRRYPEQE
jgi:YHS domain-containing protein